MKKIILLIVVFFCSIYCFAQKDEYKEDIKKAEDAIKKSQPDYATAIKYYEIARDKAPIKNREDIEKKIKDIKEQNAKYQSQKVPKPIIYQASLNDSNLPLPSITATKIGEQSYSKRSLIFPYSIIPPQKEQLLANIKRLITTPLKKNTKANEDKDAKEFFQIVENRLLGINSKKEAHFLYDSTLVAIKKQKPSEQLVSIHLRAALLYGWDLLDKATSNVKMIDSASIVIQQSIDIIDKHKFNSAKYKFALSGLENLISKYYSNVGDDQSSYKHKLLAIDYIEKALLLDPNNVFYWGSLYVYTRNFRWIPDTILTGEEKSKFTILSYSIADYMDKNISNSFPSANSIMLNIKLQVIEDKYYALSPDRKSKEALQILEKAIDKNENKWLATETVYSPIYKAATYNLMSDLYNQYIKDPTLYSQYTQKAADNIIYFLKNHSLSQYRWTGWFKDAFDNVVSNSGFSFKQNEKTDFYKSIVSAIQQGKDDYVKNENISYAYLYSNGLLADMLLSNKTQNDSIQALTYLGNSIELFEQGKYLENYSAYSEDYAKYCKSYSKIIKLYVKQENYIMAKKYYDAMMKYFNPIIKKYNFDFYLMQHIITASDAYGEFLYKQKRFKDALAPLEFASYEGIKQSTEYLVEIYGKTALKSEDLKNSYIARNAIQSPNMKRFTIPIDCAGSKQKMDVYVMDRAKGHPYKGISDQVKWLKEARGCNVPEDVTSSFNKLQDIAWENNVSFQDLCVYALGETKKTP